MAETRVSNEALEHARQQLRGSRNHAVQAIDLVLMRSVIEGRDDGAVHEAIVALAGLDRLVAQLMRHFPTKDPE